jgi:exodeoxyribonuclease-1
MEPYIMNIFAYDTETTGLQRQYDRPLQFAACLYDDDLTLLKEINLRGRLPRYVLPSPDALLTTRTTVAQIQSAPLSHYEFMRAISYEIAINSPAVMMTFNGIRYDDEILRHSFYANLLEPYLLQGNKENTRLDVLKAVRAVAACTPDAVNIPRSADGKPVFKLEGLARANGFVGHDAHDALGDVHATMHIAKVIMENAPSVWSYSQQTSQQTICSGASAGW